MIIKINGKDESVEGMPSLEALIAARQLAPEAIVVEHNFQIVPPSAWRDILLKEQDTLEIISFVGGG